MEKPTPYDPERITLPPGSGVGESSQARGSGRFAWHHEARVVSWMGREKAPRLILRRPGCNLWGRPLPADAARAHPPEPQATNGDSVKVWIRYHWFQNLDDLILLDEEEAITELKHFQLAGGQAVVEMSNNGLGRDPLSLVRISRATGLNIIMGSGYYFAASLPAGFETKTEQDITDEIVRDITVGVKSTNIKAGFIGEIGTSWPIDPREEKSLRAAVRAQQITGANLNVHPGQAEEAAFKVLEILKDAGADLTRTTIDHIDRAVRDPKNRLKLLENGLILEYDLFGREGYYPLHLRHIDLPTDHQRINEIIELVHAGFIKQILISQDIWNKHQRRKYGGWGYDHILRNAVPVMRAKGLTEEQIYTLLVENPRRVFTFV